jgi:hypothetical protein
MEVVEEAGGAAETAVAEKLFGVEASVGFSELHVPLSGNFTHAHITRHSLTSWIRGGGGTVVSAL